MLDTQSKDSSHQSEKITWIKRLFNLYDLNKNLGVFLSNKSKKEKFHTQILTAWNTLHGDCPTTVHEILNQYTSISCNQYIKIEGKLK